MHTMRFHHLGGKLRNISSQIPTLLQTDGSFKRSKGRAASILFHTSDTYSKVWNLERATDSYETEWASVYHGLLFSMNKNVYNLHIENDNQGVILNLIRVPNTKKQKPYVAEYREAILQLAKQTEFTAIRWIPRKQNRADDLFH
jgi:ribonuclease HI